MIYTLSPKFIIEYNSKIDYIKKEGSYTYILFNMQNFKIPNKESLIKKSMINEKFLWSCLQNLLFNKLKIYNKDKIEIIKNRIIKNIINSK